MRLKILTHNSGEYEVEVADYNAEELNLTLNDNNVNTIALGSVIVSRIDVKTIVPISF
jgi:hypothetical protein